ncbi:MAG: fibronectin type III domain-containing protein [Candidatus Eisenbacteria bacterium]
MHGRHLVPNPAQSFRTASRGSTFLSLLIGAFIIATIVPGRSFAQTSADSSVVLQWTAPGDDGSTGRATSYDLRYRTTPISGVDTLTWWNGATPASGEPLPGVSGATDSTRVRGLSPLTTYYFIVRAADEVPNWSGFSNVASKTTTGDNTAPAAITTLAVTGTTGSSISVRWTAPGNDGSTGTAASYDIRYSTSPITSANWTAATPATGEPAPAVAGTQQVFTLAGLSGSQTYYMAMRASDGSGNIAALSNVVSGTTADTIAPTPVRDLSMRETTAEEALALAPIGSKGDKRRAS